MQLLQRYGFLIGHVGGVAVNAIGQSGSPLTRAAVSLNHNMPNLPDILDLILAVVVPGRGLQICLGWEWHILGIDSLTLRFQSWLTGVASSTENPGKSCQWLHDTI